MLRNQANRRGPLLALIFLLLLASAADAELLPIKAYTIAEGLPHYEINKIVRDSRGFLWLCTADGLSRFDGYTFANFGTDQGLPHRAVYDLLETRNGEYWVATGEGGAGCGGIDADIKSPVVTEISKCTGSGLRLPIRLDAGFLRQDRRLPRFRSSTKRGRSHALYYSL